MIPEPVGDEAIYLFLDELAADGVITLNGVVKPYSRLIIRQKLEEAAAVREAWAVGKNAAAGDAMAVGKAAAASEALEVGKSTVVRDDLPVGKENTSAKTGAGSFTLSARQQKELDFWM
ncbi:MAG: hypothetical protein GT597_14140, partial [Bacteroidales bacterium]|nr:hypothetical protein [Bacteroidales bacterium]